MPELVVKLGENVVHKYFFDKDIISIGRARDNDVVIENLAVSRNHARIRLQDDKFIMADLNSANGTFVNGVKVSKTELVHNDIISIGKHNIHFIHETMTEDQLISDAFGADKTMIMDKTPALCLIVTKGKQKDQEFKVSQYETFIGRSTDNDISVHDWFVSKKHAKILKHGCAYFIKDLGSWKGTLLNGKNVSEAQINDGDELQFGTTKMQVKIVEQDEMALISGRVPKELGYEEPVFATSAAEDNQQPEQSPEKEAVAQSADVESVPTPPETEPEQEEDFTDQPGEGEAVQADLLEELSAEPSEVEAVIPEGAPIEQTEQPELEPTEEEERELELGDEETPLEPEPVADDGEPQEPVEEEAPIEQASPAQTPPVEIPEGVDEQEVNLWLKALKSDRELIRKHAASMLKKLTGSDYEY